MFILVFGTKIRIGKVKTTYFFNGDNKSWKFDWRFKEKAENGLSTDETKQKWEEMVKFAYFRDKKVGRGGNRLTDCVKCILMVIDVHAHFETFWDFLLRRKRASKSTLQGHRSGFSLPKKTKENLFRRELQLWITAGVWRNTPNTRRCKSKDQRTSAPVFCS